MTDWQDYDVAQVDALCICLECETGPRQKLCDWLLELSTFLIRPNVLPAVSSSSIIQHQLGPKERFPYFVARVAQARTLQIRFSQLYRRLCKRTVYMYDVQARIWADQNGALFDRLRKAATDLMGEIAVLYDKR